MRSILVALVFIFAIALVSCQESEKEAYIERLLEHISQQKRDRVKLVPAKKNKIEGGGCFEVVSRCRKKNAASELKHV